MNKMFVTKEPVRGVKCIEEIELCEDKEWELEDHTYKNTQEIRSRYYDCLTNKKFNQKIDRRLKNYG